SWWPDCAWQKRVDPCRVEWVQTDRARRREADADVVRAAIPPRNDLRGAARDRHPIEKPGRWRIRRRRREWPGPCRVACRWSRRSLDAGAASAMGAARLSDDDFRDGRGAWRHCRGLGNATADLLRSA